MLNVTSGAWSPRLRQARRASMTMAPKAPCHMEGADMHEIKRAGLVSCMIAPRTRPF